MTLDPHERQALLEDRREALRQGLHGLAITARHAELGLHAGTLLDVSRTGVRFEAAVCFPCGAELIVYAPEGFVLRPIRARIVRQKLVEDSRGTRFEYGVRFTEEAELRRHTWWLTLRKEE